MKRKGHIYWWHWPKTRNCTYFIWSLLDIAAILSRCSLFNKIKMCNFCSEWMLLAGNLHFVVVLLKHSNRFSYAQRRIDESFMNNPNATNDEKNRLSWNQIRDIPFAVTSTEMESSHGGRTMICEYISYADLTRRTVRIIPTTECNSNSSNVFESYFHRI